jgi:outer membrane protein OmpA-like peptidoglycan-associated protein
LLSCALKYTSTNSVAKEIRMNKTVILIGVVSLLTTSAVYSADRDEVYERSGFVSGALAGAAIGGAPGAIIGAGIGGLFGHELERGRDADELTTQIAGIDAEKTRLEQQLHGLIVERERLVHETRELRNRQAQNFESIEFDLFFKTGTAELEPLAIKRIAEFAGRASNQTLAVQVDGYADQRGNDPFNETLSESRAVAVRDALVHGGLSPEKIVILGHGSRESLASDGDLDAYALERRVTVTVSSASRPEDGVDRVAQSDR